MAFQFGSPQPPPPPGNGPQLGIGAPAPPGNNGSRNAPPQFPFGHTTRPLAAGEVFGFRNPPASFPPPRPSANQDRGALPPPKPLVYKLLTESATKKRRCTQRSSTAIVASKTSSVSIWTVTPKLDGIPKLLFVDLQAKEGDTVVSALDQLFHLFNLFHSEDEWKKKREEALGLGAIGLLLVVMRKWLDDEDIQELTCANLAVLCFENNTSSSKGATDVFSVSGGMEAVVSALKKFPQSAEVQYTGISVLVIALLFHPDSWTQPTKDAMKHFLGELNGVDVILDAMDSFPDHEDLLCQCCDFFYRTVMAEAKYRSLFWKAGALAAVATTLQNHLENEDIQASGKGFLKEMLKERD